MSILLTILTDQYIVIIFRDMISKPSPYINPLEDWRATSQVAGTIYLWEGLKVEHGAWRGGGLSGGHEEEEGWWGETDRWHHQEQKILRSIWNSLIIRVAVSDQRNDDPGAATAVQQAITPIVEARARHHDEVIFTY